MPKPVVSVEDVWVSNRRDHVLRGVNLCLTQSQSLAIYGPEGPGKTALISCLAGLRNPKSGRVILGDACISDLNDRSRARLRVQRLGLIFEQDNLLDELSVQENILLPLNLCKRDSIKQRIGSERPFRLIKRLGLSEVKDESPRNLDDYQKQLATLARAVVLKPELVLADEPTGCLGAGKARSFLKFLLELTREYSAGLILATRDESMAKACDLSRTLKDGQLI